MTDIESSSMPASYGCRHLAIIMDGNGRWAKSRMLPRVMGHREGAKRVKDIVKAAPNLGVEFLTLYVFSSENWSRPEEEVGFLMNLLLATLEKELRALHRNNVQLNYIGNWRALNEKLVTRIAESVELTKDNTGLKLYVALNYGGRDEIVQASKSIAKAVEVGTLKSDEIDHALFESYLYSPQLPAVDLMIRTSGEMRLSNFLLWQAAYAEFYFTPTLWPDFDETQLELALQDFANRERRFGGI